MWVILPANGNLELSTLGMDDGGEAAFYPVISTFLAISTVKRVEGLTNNALNSQTLETKELTPSNLPPPESSIMHLVCPLTLRFSCETVDSVSTRTSIMVKSGCMIFC